MSLQGAVRCALALTAMCGQIAAATIAAGAAPAGPATRPHAVPPAKGPIDEKWISRIVLDELQAQTAATRYWKESDYDGLARRTEAAMLARLRCGHLNQLAALNDMVYVRRACRYIPLAVKTADKAFGAWLVDNREVSRLLFRAMEGRRKPQEALKNLHELYKASAKAVAAYPNMSVAFATAKTGYAKTPRPCTMLEGFKYYTCGKFGFRYNLRKMPYELSIYLADTRLSLAERAWVQKNYGYYLKNLASPANTCGDVPYDTAFVKGRAPKKIDKVAYTLPNLRRVGGICGDGAYYASQVCKSLGVPAAVVGGRGKAGIGHAWVASLRVSEGKAYWNFRAGRISGTSSGYFTGSTRDPGTGRSIDEGELIVLGYAAQIPLQRREEADAAIALAKLADKTAAAGDKPNLDGLYDLAKRYDVRFLPPRPILKTAGWIYPHRTVDRGMVSDLVARSLQRNLGHRPAWDFIVESLEKKRMSLKDVPRFLDFLVSKTATRYPDYGFVIAMRVVPHIPDADVRRKFLQRMNGVFGKRQDLRGKILMALGNDYLQEGRESKAAVVFATAAEQCDKVADVVLGASLKAEMLFLRHKRSDLAINMYRKLFKRTPTPSKGIVWGSTVYYQLGDRLRKLLLRAGKTGEAREVAKRIKRVVPQKSD